MSSSRLLLADFRDEAAVVELELDGVAATVRVSARHPCRKIWA
jgi:hypothetical protein